MSDDEEVARLRTSALQNMQAVLAARKRADEQLRRIQVALEDETRVLELLNRTGERLSSQLEIEAVVQMVTDAGTEMCGAQFGAFFYTLKHPDGGVLTLFTLSGAPREAFERFGHPRATPVFAPTFEGKGVLRSGDIRSDPRYGQLGPHHGMPTGHLPVVSYLAVPVRLRTGEVVGGLFFGHPEPNVFTERAERLITGLASQAAIALDNAKLYETAKRSADAERAARAEVERISLMKDEFLSTLSHELRTPLNAILGWSEMLLAKADPESMRGLETISRNARAQAQLIEDLLDMNRIISGKLRLDVQRVALVSVIESAIDTIRPSADAKSLRLHSTLDPHAGPIYGDPHRLQQVVWNLLSNAVKFTPKGGKIHVLLARVNSHVELTISDSGIGITPEFLPQVFERFRQADSSTTRKYGGLGLGLSIVKQLVELHGGNVRVDSAGENAGTTFVVSLPVRALREVATHEHPTTKSITPSRLPDLSLAGVSILVVDDELDARELVKSVLTSVKATVTDAASANEALDILATRAFDLIISDIGMPDRDGYQFIRAVRARGVKIPAVALTAFARSEDRTRALIAGYQVHVAKPIEPQELIVTLASMLGRMIDDEGS